jgi:Heme/copper-type cytochrome/quinol oxidases, subunit 2
MPLGLALLILLVIFGSMGALLARHWLPILVSVQGAAIDQQLHLSLAWMGAAFVLTQAALALFIWRFHQNRKVRTRAPSSNPLFEVLAIVVTASAFLWLGATGGMFASDTSQGHDSALHVEVTGMQFQWYFRYAGTDGKFGNTKPELIDASIGNPLGLDRSDPAARDDKVESQLVLPADREVDLVLHAQDVVHSFFVPAMRVQMNAVPGMTTHLRFTPNRPGTYEAVCSQLCGLGHYRMKAVVRVLSAKEYDQWQQETFAQH